MTVNIQAVILVDQLDTMIISERERAFLEAEMSVFSEEIKIGCRVIRLLGFEWIHTYWGILVCMEVVRDGKNVAF